MASSRGMSTHRVPESAGCQNAGTKGTQNDGNRRNRNHVTGRVHAAEYPVLGANGALLRPGRTRLPRPRRLRRRRRDGHLRARQQRDSARGRAELRPRTAAPGGLRGGRGRRHRPCPAPPVKRDPAADVERGRGLLVVEALSARWGWPPHDPGKAVFAIFTREG